MRTSIVTAPATIPVTVAEAKAHLGVTHTDDDTLIERLVYAATASVEKYLCRKLITQTWKMYLDAWPTVIKVYYGDLQAVTHIKYTDTGGTQSTFSSDYYDVSTVSVPGRIGLTYGYSWPSDALRAIDPIEIQFVTGYGDAITDVPQPIREAILLDTSHMYEYREPIVTGTIVSKIPRAIESRLSDYRVWDWVL